MEQKVFLNSYSERCGFCRCVSRSHLCSVCFQRAFSSGGAFCTPARGRPREPSVTLPASCWPWAEGAVCLPPEPLTLASSLHWCCSVGHQQPVTTLALEEQGQCGPIPAPTWPPEVKCGFSCCKGTPASTHAPSPSWCLVWREQRGLQGDSG